MNIAKRLDQYDENCVYLCESIKNNIMTDSYFIRILYSNSLLTLNGIYLIIKLNNVICEKHYNKFKCAFDPVEHCEIINAIKQIEYNLLKKSEIANKVPQYKIYELLKSGVIKIFNEMESCENIVFLLKISGVWETQYSYGLTYKFITTLNA